MHDLEDSRVALFREKGIKYPAISPFHASEAFPEYPYSSPDSLSEHPNHVYGALRKVFMALELDSENYGTSKWNPLGVIIHPGNNVLIKPNFVRHYHAGGGDIRTVISHGSVIRTVLDYAVIALRGKGNIIIGDSPVQDCDFKEVIRILELDRVIKFVSRESGIPIKLVDFRMEQVCKDINDFSIFEKKMLSGDPSGYSNINLNCRSFFNLKKQYFHKFRVHDYDEKETLIHHEINKNEYLIPNSVFYSDVMISIPKLKTHKKAGITSSLKNFIGISGSKAWLPHYCSGSLCEGGDEYFYSSFRKKIITEIRNKLSKSSNYKENYKINFLYKWFVYFLVRSSGIFPYNDSFLQGSWYGNDTLWRTILDLNQIFFFTGTDGMHQNKQVRKYMTIVDGIISGQNEGPMTADRMDAGVLISGFNPLQADRAASELMGFPWRKIPALRHCADSGILYARALNSPHVFLCGDIEGADKIPNLKFVPPPGWESLALGFQESQTPYSSKINTICRV